MYVDCLDCPLRASAAFRRMSADELEFVRHTKSGERRYPAKADIVIRGDPNAGLHTIFSGWAFRYLTLRDGSRQILDIMLPGDLIGLQSPMTGKVHHSIQALTNVRVCCLDEARLHDLFKLHPAMSEALLSTLLTEEQRSDARLLLLGRQRPTERLGYLLLELRERLERRGVRVMDGYQLPLTYNHLCDAIGVSRSQIGASIREMQARNWAMLREGQLTFLDPERMSRECEYLPLPAAGLRTLI